MRWRVPWALVAMAIVVLARPVDVVAQVDDEPPPEPPQEVDVEGEDFDATDLEGRSLGAFVGINLDASDPLIGADARWTWAVPEVAPWLALAINPAFSWQFVDAPPNASAQGFQIDVNGLAKFAIAERVVPYAGVGVAMFITRISPDVGTTSTETDANVNLLVGGVKLDIDQPFDVFGQFRVTNQTVGSALTMMGGISASF